MPSGWTNSGIDWTSVDTMRKSRTEDIVRHLYLAVNERDYWIRFNSGSFVTLDRIGRLRTNQQIRYIYEKLKAWFKPIGEYPPNNFSFDNSESVFIDDTNVPQVPTNNPNELLYSGYGSIDYSAGGNLEAIIGEDLSFIRNYLATSYRVSLSELRIVYKILNTHLRSRLFHYIKQSTLYKLINPVNNSTQSLVLGKKSVSDFDGSGEKPNSSQANANFYNSNDINYGSFISNRYEGFLQIAWFNTGLYFVTQDKQGVRFSPVGYDSNQYNINDFNFKSFSYGFLEDGILQDEFDITPLSAYTWGHLVVENEFKNVPSSETVTLGGIHGFMHQDFVASGLPVVTRTDNIRQRSIQDSFSIPFIDLNKEGFLNYYTEPTP